MTPRAILTTLASLTCGACLCADDLIPGAHDQEAVKVLRAMARSLPLRTTTLEKIAPDFVVAKIEGLTWDEAVAEADKRFGTLQPQRAAFLRKYLVKGSPEKQLAQLQLPDSGFSTITGGGHSRGFVFGPEDKPTATINVWIAEGVIIEAPSLSMSYANVDGYLYCSLRFDMADKLTSVNYETTPAPGRTFCVGENTSGEGGKIFFWALIGGPDGESELLSFMSDLVIKERHVTIPKQQKHYLEIYEKGKLRRRAHYKERQTAYGTETYVAREEKFP